MMYASACTASVDRNRPYCIFKQKTKAHAKLAAPRLLFSQPEFPYFFGELEKATFNLSR